MIILEIAKKWIVLGFCVTGAAIYGIYSSRKGETYIFSGLNDNPIEINLIDLENIRKQKTLSKIESLKVSLELYRKAYKKYPESLDLLSLVKIIDVDVDPNFMFDEFGDIFVYKTKKDITGFFKSYELNSKNI